KEKEEQQIVTDFIVEGLHKSVDKIEVSEVQTVRAGHLLHLKTDILATIHPKTFHMGALLEQLHPTPAVCGLPKSIAKRFILQNEQYDREYYTGFLGELNFKEKLLRNPNGRNIENNAYASVKLVSQLYVNLRCMQLKDNQVSVYVGGGITKDSVPEKEWEETVSKSQIIKSIL
ncbi:MAG TPA: chorismate-binding protein, partial [Aquaticitalea sp.]|nr:chorismate-binding protein [Aquaticitalea sp.]